MPHEAFYANAAGVIPIFLILLVFQTREYRYGAAKGWRRPFYAVVVGADIIFAGAAEIVAMFALFRIHDRTCERDFVFAAVAGLTAYVAIVGLKLSAARRFLAAPLRGHSGTLAQPSLLCPTRLLR